MTTLSPSATRSARRQLRSNREPFTDRELAVLRGLAEGRTGDQIAASLRILARTERRVRAGVYRKLGALNGPHAVNLGWALGLLGGEDR